MNEERPHLEYDVLAVMLAARQVRSALRQALRGVDLQPGQELLLLAIGHGEPDQVELVDRLRVGQPTVSRGVSRLEAKGFLVKTKSTGDGRVALVRLTPAGLELLPRIEKAWNSVNSQLLSNLSAAETQTMVELLSRLNGVVEDG